MLVIPTSACTTSLGVNFASHQRFVIIFLWNKKWFVGKLFALEETAAVLFDVALQVRVNGSQTLGQLGRASEAYVLARGSRIVEGTCAKGSGDWLIDPSEAFE